MNDRKKELELINKTQYEYETLLIEKLLKPIQELKSINFTSPTGTGKTKMMADIVNRMDETIYFFIITTLSRGQLKYQIDEGIHKNSVKNNYAVFGLNDFTKASTLKEEDILNLLPKNKKIIWFRDEGHINTNRWAEILAERSFKIVNFSATNNRNSEEDIRCNFNHTMMLRTVIQQEGTPEDAIDKLIEVKAHHEKVKNYNPCAIFRLLDDSLLEKVILLCKKKKLKWINITDEDYIMKEICEDDNEYDVIINKFKIVEGIDIRRAHVLYMTNEPKNPATTIQVIGRCRRNALLYRDDIDILDPQNSGLLKHTRNCYVFYNVKGMKIAEDLNGDLVTAFCDTISIEQLKPNISIELKQGYMKNGLKILESKKDNDKYLSGRFKIIRDVNIGFNMLSNNDNVPFYSSIIKKYKFNRSGYYITCSGIKTGEDLNECASVVTNTAVPIEQVRKFWFKSLENGTTIYRNYGCVDVTLRICLNKKKIYDAIDKFVVNYDDRVKISIVDGYRDKKCILISIYRGYSFINNDNIFDEYYYDFKNKRVISRTHTLKDNYLFDIYSDRTTLKKEIGLIDKNLLSSLVGDLNYYYFYFPISIKSKDDTLSISDGKIAKVVYKNYVGSKTFTYPYCSVKYDKNSKVLSDYCFKSLEYNSLLEDLKLNIDDIDDIKNTYVSFSLKVDITQYNYNTLTVSDDDIKYDNEMVYFDYSKICNDKESSILGADLMKYVSSNGKYVFIEDSSITSKIAKYTKLRIYLNNNYKKIIEKTSEYYFKENIDFNFSKKCNSMLGYLVEYYIKYLLYGEIYLYKYTSIARKEAKNKAKYEDIIIRACMLKYKELMISAFGDNIASSLGSKMISMEKLDDDEYSDFKNTIIRLSTGCIDIVRNNIKIYDDNMIHDPNLSINHITGLADILDEETIMDIKCTSSINEKSILQLLGYYYLSKKRTDLHIKNLIVLDAITKRYIKINMETGEIIVNFNKKKQNGII